MYENNINDKIFRYCLNMQQNIEKCWRTEELVFFDSAKFDSTTSFARLPENEMSVYRIWMHSNSYS